MKLTPQRSLFRLIPVLAIIVPFFLFADQAHAQARLEAPVKLKIEDGNFDEVSVIIKNTTTNETNTVAGSAKFNLEFKLNCNYVISFTKPGYITKKIAFNTAVPEHRMTQGFYPFTFEVNLFQQYDGVNIVVFNQPVGKISYSRLIDDFDYDTDYTKQIQSQLKAAEEEILQKQKENKIKAEQAKKDEEKRKAEELAQAKAEEKALKEKEKKEAEEARLQAIEDAKQKKLEEEQRKAEAKALLEEEKRQKAIATIEEEERRKLAASQEEEQRKQAQTGSGNETRPGVSAGTGDDSRITTASATAGIDNNPTKPAVGSGDDDPGKKAAMGSGEDDLQTSLAKSTKGSEKGFEKASGIEGEDSRPESKSLNTPKTAALPAHTEYEKLPDISIDEITEPNRTITRVTVRNGSKETVFSKVVYNWGGVYYFRSNLSISPSLYKLKTGQD